ncbi:MAG: GTP cyclohydrolase I [Oceanicoccus sp.]|jgi:GTP cyclohydrolase I
MNREELIRQLIESIDPNPGREGLVDTPRRVNKSYEHLFGGYKMDPAKMITTFANEGYNDMILVKDIEFYSFCEHHMIPFFGRAHIAYIPGDRIVGLSKIPRLVDIFSRRLQNQERITTQIAQAIMDLIAPKGVAVVLEAQHLCMMSRGVEKQNSTVTTSSLHGLFKKRPETRAEFLRLLDK